MNADSDTPSRAFLCTCGRTLGIIARDRRGPVTLTPDSDATFLIVTGAIVWLRCACGLDTPWFVVPGRGVVPPPHGTLQS